MFFGQCNVAQWGQTALNTGIAFLCCNFYIDDIFLSNLGILFKIVLEWYTFFYTIPATITLESETEISYKPSYWKENAIFKHLPTDWGLFSHRTYNILYFSKCMKCENFFMVT